MQVDMTLNKETNRLFTKNSNWKQYNYEQIISIQLEYLNPYHCDQIDSSR